MDAEHDAPAGQDPDSDSDSTDNTTGNTDDSNDVADPGDREDDGDDGLADPGDGEDDGDDGLANPEWQIDEGLVVMSLDDDGDIATFTFQEGLAPFIQIFVDSSSATIVSPAPGMVVADLPAGWQLTEAVRNLASDGPEEPHSGVQVVPTNFVAGESGTHDSPAGGAELPARSQEQPDGERYIELDEEQGESGAGLAAAAGIPFLLHRRPGADPSGPDVPTAQTIFVESNKPAPEEGKGRNTPSAADSEKLRNIKEKYNPELGKQDAGHKEPFSQTPPGVEQKLRNEDPSLNRKDGASAIRRENALRREQPDWRDPESPNYTRPGSGRAGPETAAGGGAPPPEAARAAPPPPEHVPPPPEGHHGSPAPEPARLGAFETVASKAGKLLGIAGEALMVHQFAGEIDWRTSIGDPKWGNVHEDMFGNVWYRSPHEQDVWWNTPNPPGA